MPKEILEEKTRVWEGLSEYEISSDDFLDSVDGEMEGNVNILRRMQVNQYFVVARMIGGTDTCYFQRIITELNEEGLDIGKGDAEYGYKMPLSKNGKTGRELIIFRRHK